jgi:GNAT superfamily N-acetyltransferase
VKVSIRRAGASDCSALTQLMHESSAYKGAYSAILEGYRVLPEQADSAYMYVAEAGQSILGFYSLLAADGGAELDLMFVCDGAQRQGVGTKLFGHMKALAASLNVRTVKIVSHPPSEHFYRRMGAIAVGTQPPSGRVSWSRPILSLPVQNAV